MAIMVHSVAIVYRYGISTACRPERYGVGVNDVVINMLFVHLSNINSRKLLFIPAAMAARKLLDGNSQSGRHLVEFQWVLVKSEE